MAQSSVSAHGYIGRVTALFFLSAHALKLMSGVLGELGAVASWDQCGESLLRTAS